MTVLIAVDILQAKYVS